MYVVTRRGDASQDKSGLQERDASLAATVDAELAVADAEEAIAVCVANAAAQCAFAQLHALGYLAEWESLLSTSGSEAGMLRDAHQAVKAVSDHFVFSLRPVAQPARAFEVIEITSVSECTGKPLDCVVIGYPAAHPAAALLQGEITRFRAMQADGDTDGLSSGAQKMLIRIRPLLFTQGINEKQTVANLLGKNRLQQEINEHSLHLLSDYVTEYKTFARREVSLAATSVSAAVSRAANNHSVLNIEQAVRRVVATQQRVYEVRDNALIDKDISKDVIMKKLLKMLATLPDALPPTTELANCIGRASTIADITTGTKAAFAKTPVVADRDDLENPPSSTSTVVTLVSKVGALIERLDNLVTKFSGTVHVQPGGKNVAVLQDAAALARLLGAGRLVSCKSAKDRTSMSVTLEQAQLLWRHHGLGEPRIPRVAALMRLHGVRLDNVQRNIGRRTFAFNWLQQQQLPAQYKPPRAAAGSAVS